MFKRNLSTYLIFLSFFYILLLQNLHGEEPQINFSFKEDGRKWNLAFKDSNDEQKIFEYIPEGTNLNYWVDLATVQYMKGANIPAKTYYEKFNEALKKSVPYNKVQTKLIKEEPNSVFWEWWIDDNSPLDQHEWIKVFVDGNNTAFLRYTTKDKKNAETYRKAWEKIIGEATLNTSAKKEAA